MSDDEIKVMAEARKALGALHEAFFATRGFSRLSWGKRVALQDADRALRDALALFGEGSADGE